MNYKRHTNSFGTKLGRCGVTGKVIFRTEGAAKQRIKEILSEETNRANNYLRAFQCNRCGYWHLTSKQNQKCNSIPNSISEKLYGTSAAPQAV